MTAQLVAILSFGVMVLIHVVSTVWWASKVNTTLQIVVKDVGDLVVELKAMKDTYVKKEDFAKAVSDGNRHRDSMWKKIDDLRDLVGGRKN